MKKMISTIKEVLYKILVMSMICIVLVFFSASSVCHAKITLEEGQFYYTGTQEANYVVKGSFWEGILGSLAEIANYLLGIKMLGYRAVVVGWIEIMEIILTALVGEEFKLGEFFKESLAGIDNYSQQIVNVEKIIFNEIELLDANIFRETTEFEEIEN